MGLRGRYTTPSWGALWGTHLTTHSSPPPLEGPALDVMPSPQLCVQVSSSVLGQLTSNSVPRIPTRPIPFLVSSF